MSLLPSTRQAVLLLSALLLGTTAPRVDAQIYKSVGADGRPVYSDVAPSSDKATKVWVVKTEPAPLASEAARSHEQKEAARRKAQEEKESRHIRERLAATEATRVCEAARQALKELEWIDGRPAYWQGPNGERTYLSDEQRAAAQKNAQQAFARNCP